MPDEGSQSRNENVRAKLTRDGNDDAARNSETDQDLCRAGRWDEGGRAHRCQGHTDQGGEAHERSRPRDVDLDAKRPSTAARFCGSDVL